MARKILTDAGIRAALSRAKKSGAATWTADGQIPRSHGGLQLYAHPNGSARWYWRYSAPNGSKPRIALGAQTFEPTPGALTLAEARAAVAEKAALYQKPESRDVRAALKREAEREAAEAAAAAKARAAELADAAEAGTHTLAGLMEAYAAHLAAQGKPSARDVRTMTKNHIVNAHPALAATPAKDVTSEALAEALRTLTTAGKGRTAGKLRSYLRRAYALAAGARLDPDLPAGFVKFRCAANPAQPIPALSKYNRTRERALSEPELRAYWQALNDAPDSPPRDAQILGLLLGGQRPAQLLRAAVADVDVAGRTITLRDPKGRRQQPRLHVLPITDAALPAVERCLARAEAKRCDWLFSMYGRAPLAAQTVADHCNEIAAALMAAPKAQRIVKEAFQLRDIRRTAETRMAALGISRDVRAQILSHGISGVQATHYDRHTYATEKRAALAAWAALLETKPADNVQPIRGRAAR